MAELLVIVFMFSLAAVGLPYLAVSVYKKYKDAAWQAAWERVEQAPKTDEECELEEEMVLGDLEDDEFFIRTCVEAKVAQMPTDTESLQWYCFSKADYPDARSRLILVEELAKRNPHVKGLRPDGAVYKVVFGPIEQPAPPPLPKCKHGFVEDECKDCHVCYELPCDRKDLHGPEVVTKLAADVEKVIVEKDALFPGLSKGTLEQQVAELWVQVQELGERVTALQANLPKPDPIREFYEAMPTSKLTKAVKTLPKFFSPEHPHVKVSRSVAQERVKTLSLEGIVPPPELVDLPEVTGTLTERDTRRDGFGHLPTEATSAKTENQLYEDPGVELGLSHNAQYARKPTQKPVKKSPTGRRRKSRR